MIANLPNYINLIFILTVALSIYFFYKASNFSKITLNILVIWVSIQVLLGINGFYTTFNTIPPRFLAMVLPPIVGIVILMSTKNGRKYMGRFNLKYLTLIHSVRVPVEIVLYLLFLHQAIPQLMTFEGLNHDIVMGVSAPIVLTLAFRGGKLKRTLLLIWNIIGLALLANIVVLSVRSSPSTFQSLAFDQPNIGMAYFPYNLLPSVIVPLVLISHLISIRFLLKK